MTLLNTTLQIVRGVFKAPGDAFSAENDLFILELQDPAGFSLQVDGWSPNLPALKGGGTWAESAINDGRIPLAQSVGNVTETMRLTMGNGDLQQRFAIFRKLQLMRQSVIDFWDGTAQIDPVYIRWHAAIGKGEQYALIYNLEIAQDSDIFNPEQAWDVTITIERESYWRGIWPGGNPKEWTLGVVRGLVRGQARYQTANMDLTSDSDHFVYSTTVNNALEWTPASVGRQITPLSRNYVEISGADIPGDAPALLELAIVNNDTNYIRQLFLALSSKPLQKTDHLNIQRAQAYNFAGGDADGAGWSKTNVGSTLGLRSNNSSSIYYVAENSIGTGATTNSLAWGDQSSTIIDLDRSLLRGDFAVFLRARVTTGATGEVKTSTFRFSETGGPSGSSLENQYNLPALSITAHTTNMILHYAGRISLPLDKRSNMSLKGYGQQIREISPGNLKIEMRFTNSSAGTRVLQICDLLLLPIDEGMIQIPTGIAGSTGQTHFVIDDTNYLTHGYPDPRCRLFIDSGSLGGGFSKEMRGIMLELKPGVDQRIYVLSVNEESFNIVFPNQTFTMRGNIIPRWAGIRDV